MNTKRQTIWLVSMLSLMVVLSVYYLFTDNTDNTKQTADQSSIDQTANINVDQTNQDVAGMDAASTDTATTDTASTDKATTDKATTDTATTGTATTGTASTDKAATDTAAAGTGTTDTQGNNAVADTNTVSPADQNVLNQLNTTAVSGDQYFAAQEMKRTDELSKEYERLMAITTDTDKDVKAVTAAQNELDLMQDEQAKITNIEDILAKDYKNAIVSKDLNKWKVTVESNKLEKSEAVSIIDMVMKELKASADQVVVTYIP